MLLTNELSFTFPAYQKVLDHCIALNNTLVIAARKTHQKFTLTHIDQQGKILGEILFAKQGVNELSMSTDRDVYGLLPTHSTIVHWNLETHERTDIVYHFVLDLEFYSRMFIFPLSKLICVQEHGCSYRQFFKLRYFGLPFDAGSDPVEEYEDMGQMWSQDLTIITKGNNDSMICWLKPHFTHQFQFNSYQLGVGFKSYRIKNTLGALDGGKDLIEVNVAAMWEMRKGEFLFVCHTSRERAEEKLVNDNYVVDVGSQTIREAKFTFATREEHMLHLDQMSFGASSMVRTIRYQKGQALPSTIYYIDNQSERIIATELWKCSHLNKYHLPGFDGSLLVEGLYENGNVSCIKLQVKKILDGKEISVFLLNEILPDWDQDLLYDVTQVIDYSK